MHKVKGVQDLNTNELKSRVAGTSASWHEQYRHSAYIYVGGLDYNLTEGDIICIFSQFGEIMDLNMVRDKATGKAKGFCFIAYEDQRSTDLAVDNFNGAKVCGKTLSVDHVGKYRGPKPPGSDEDAPEEKISVAPADFMKLEKEKKKAKKAEKAAMKEGKAIQKKAKALAKEARRAERAKKKASRNSGKEGELSEKLGVSEEERQTIMARRAKLLEQATHISDSGSGSEKDPMETMRKVAKNDDAYTDRTERPDVNTKRIENTAADIRHESKRRSRSRDGNARHTADMQHGKNRTGAKLKGEARNGEVTDRTTDEVRVRNRIDNSDTEGRRSRERDRRREGERSSGARRYRSRDGSRSRSRSRERDGSRKNKSWSADRYGNRDTGRDGQRSRDLDDRRDSSRNRRRERSRSADRRGRGY